MKPRHYYPKPFIKNSVSSFCRNYVRCVGLRAMVLFLHFVHANHTWMRRAVRLLLYFVCFANAVRLYWLPAQHKFLLNGSHTNDEKLWAIQHFIYPNARFTDCNQGTRDCSTNLWLKLKAIFCFTFYFAKVFVRFLIFEPFNQFKHFANFFHTFRIFWQQFFFIFFFIDGIPFQRIMVHIHSIKWYNSIVWLYSALVKVTQAMFWIDRQFRRSDWTKQGEKTLFEIYSIIISLSFLCDLRFGITSSLAKTVSYHLVWEKSGR